MNSIIACCVVILTHPQLVIQTLADGKSPKFHIEDSPKHVCSVLVVLYIPALAGALPNFKMFAGKYVLLCVCMRICNVGNEMQIVVVFC